MIVKTAMLKEHLPNVDDLRTKVWFIQQYIGNFYVQLQRELKMFQVRAVEDSLIAGWEQQPESLQHEPQTPELQVRSLMMSICRQHATLNRM